MGTDNLLFFDKGITREQAGEYMCIAENRHGASEIKTKFNVLCKFFLSFLSLTHNIISNSQLHLTVIHTDRD